MMHRNARASLKCGALLAVAVAGGALLQGCGDSAKPVSEDSKAKYMEMMQKQQGNKPGPSGPSGGGGGMNGPK